MTDVQESLTRKQLTTLALIGLSILILFAAGFAWIYYYIGVLGNGGVDVFLAVAPFCILPYLIVISIYVAFFMAKFAKGRWRYPWLWGFGGFALTVLFSVGLPILLSPVFPYQSPVIFTFLAPVLSTLAIMLLISIRKKVTL